MGSTLMQRVAEREDAEVVCLHQRSREKAEAALGRLGLPARLYKSEFESLINHPDVQAVFICSTNQAHGVQSIAAMEAGKHVFCEKPCATEFDEFCRQIELSKERPELVTFVDYLMNFDTMEDWIRRMVSDGAFGTLTQVQVNYRHPINIQGDKIWKLSRHAMGDAIGMGIVHSISVMLNILDAQGAKPCAVYATACGEHVREFEVPAIWNIQIEFDNGATGFCFGNVDQANGYDACHNIHGTKGGFIFDSYLDRPSKIRYWSEEKTGRKWIYPLDRDRCKKEGVRDMLWPEDTTTPDSGDVVHHQTGACVEHFLDCIHRGTQSSLSFGNAATVAEVGFAAQISAARKTRVELPLNYEDARYFFFSHSRMAS